MNYLAVVVVIGFLLLVHEFGHLMMAIRAGVPVERFSVGFGPVLKRFNRNGIDYCLSLFPFGGYVSLRVADEQDYYNIAVGKRILFALGGPLANFALVIPLFSVINIAANGLSLNSLLVQPIIQTFSFFVMMLGSIKEVFQSPEHVSSVVGIVAQGGQFIGSSMINLIKLTALLSLNLAVLNLLPIPVLDGGQILLTLFEKLFPRITRVRVPLAIAGWAFMIGLLIYATVMDVSKLA